MLQALTTLIFLAMAFAAVVVIGLLLRSEWNSVSVALGLDRRAPERRSLPRVRTGSARRAIMLRVQVPSLRKRAAA